MNTTPDICTNRHRGNAESAAANNSTDKTRDGQRILRYLLTVPDATCDEVEVALNMNHQTASARMSELKSLGVIQPTTRRPTRSGCKAMAWAVRGMKGKLWCANCGTWGDHGSAGCKEGAE